MILSEFYNVDSFGVKVTVDSPKMFGEVKLISRISFLKGDSAKGKTVFCNSILSQDTDPNVVVKCTNAYQVRVIQNVNSEIIDSIFVTNVYRKKTVFIFDDEFGIENRKFKDFIKNKDLLLNRDYYILIINRNLLYQDNKSEYVENYKNRDKTLKDYLEYDAFSILYAESKIVNGKSYFKTVPCVSYFGKYNGIAPDIILCEDKHGMKSFIESWNEKNIEVLSSQGKNNYVNVLEKLLQNNSEKRLIAYLDLFNGGSILEGIFYLYQTRDIGKLWIDMNYFSFEYLVLESNDYKSLITNNVVSELNNIKNFEEFFEKFLLKNYFYGSRKKIIHGKELPICLSMDCMYNCEVSYFKCNHMVKDRLVHMFKGTEFEYLINLLRG